MRQKPTISRRYAERILEAAGKHRPYLESRIALHPIHRADDVRIAASEYLALWHLAMERLEDPSFPLKVAQHTGLETYEVFGFAVMTSSNLREALERAGRYLKIWADLATWDLKVTKGLASLRLVPAEERKVDTFAATVCAFAEMYLSMNRYLGVQLQLHEVRFRRKSPSDVKYLSSFFKAPLKFECSETALVFAESHLAQPLAKSDSAMSEYFTRHAEEMLSRLPHTDSISGEAQVLVASLLSQGTPTLEVVAHNLKMSSRTLRRRLEEEGYNFQSLLQDTRTRLAKQHLREERLALAEIAFMLGFSDVSAFHRAFKRWVGVTPAEFRATPKV